MSADAIRISADILIVFLPILIILKNKHIQILKRNKERLNPKLSSKAQDYLEKEKTKRDRPHEAVAFERNILRWWLNTLNDELSVLDVGSDNHNII
ncbi:hypothetical protein FHS60_001772 [Alloprevotella rava]|uniref:Uncharacterized protein n=1 Tax=Alloprevotella rava TaxID=671218 RepID=A0A7W5UJW4_9BACT|nr:hypothetical protein [Alloprevotella rava]